MLRIMSQKLQLASLAPFRQPMSFPAPVSQHTNPSTGAVNLVASSMLMCATCTAFLLICLVLLHSVPQYILVVTQFSNSYVLFQARRFTFPVVEIKPRCYYRKAMARWWHDLGIGSVCKSTNEISVTGRL